MKQVIKFLSLLLMLLMGASLIAGQTPKKTQRPVKNPPQFPNIIDLEKKGSAVEPKVGEEQAVIEAAPGAAAALVKAVEGLALEVRVLVQEMRALNVRQQAQLDMLRLTRGDLRTDGYERELKSVTDRLTQLEIDEATMRSAMTPEGLAAQVSRFGTIDRDQTMRQIKYDLEIRLSALLPEKQRLQQREGELKQVIAAIRDANEQAERRIEMVEEALRQLNLPVTSEEKKAVSTERKP